MILVIDDHEATRYVLVRLLKANGHEAVGVCDGSQALLFLQTHRPRLIILDCHMPCLDGFDVLSAVRSDAALADVSVVMFSADPSAEERAVRLGADGFILKGSLDWGRLSAAVERYAGSRAGNAGRAAAHPPYVGPDVGAGGSKP
jgi:CheY-like chemotaxis protein